ncbi:MAG: TIGR00282 family metallophosphoesterase [Treponema sp.]|jgi:metallophosphoesterase (TIGR00282 family)|nr:TIGR00282 family metallophosphoesterase [Treponema sp.]
MDQIRVAMIGDVVGNPGLEALEAKLPLLIKEHQIDFVTVNGENADEGFGMTEENFRRIIIAGADVVTSGNHIWENREFWPVLEAESNILRPANYPSGSPTVVVPGAGFVCINKKGINWIVINLQGRELMSPIDCPFQSFDRLINTHNSGSSIASPVILVDFHAESTREKEALAFYVDGRVSLIAGTHTHVQTADERILPKGSAYITDLGMTGNTNSVIGMDPKICLERFNKLVMYQLKTAAAKSLGQVQGVIAEIDASTGRAVSVKRITG